MRSVTGKFAESEDGFISSNYLAMSSRDIAINLSRSEKSISDRIAGLGLRRFRTKAFTHAEDEVIRSSKGRNSADIARELGRAPSVIRTRAKRLGISNWKEWSGGYKEFRGYKVSKIERGDGNLARRVPEHRHIMEQHLGRRLEDSERVHHINMRKRDNRIENLYLCQSDDVHSRAHHSISGFIAELLERGVIYFNRDKGVYELCEIR